MLHIKANILIYKISILTWAFANTNLKACAHLMMTIIKPSALESRVLSFSDWILFVLRKMTYLDWVNINFIMHACWQNYIFCTRTDKRYYYHLNKWHTAHINHNDFQVSQDQETKVPRKEVVQLTFLPFLQCSVLHGSSWVSNNLGFLSLPHPTALRQKGRQSSREEKMKCFLIQLKITMGLNSKTQSCWTKKIKMYHLGSLSFSFSLNDLLPLVLFGFFYVELSSLRLLLGCTETYTTLTL